MIDFEKSEKLPRHRRYFNISVIWIFYFRYVIRLLYWLRIPHEMITLLSILLGMTAAYFFYNGSLIAGAVALHLKDIFDASDGAIARLTGRGHLIGRYLDSLGDFLSLTMVMLAIGLHVSEAGDYTYLIWSGSAIVSTFIQCSFFNYYQLAYLETFGVDTLSSKRDEVSRDDKYGGFKSAPARAMVVVFRFFYIIVYSWQDKLVAYTDRKLIPPNTILSEEQRFGNKELMVFQSTLCFGTHIFIIIIAALIGKPAYSLIFIGIVMNIYLMFVLYFRKRHYRKKAGKISAHSRPETQTIED